MAACETQSIPMQDLLMGKWPMQLQQNEKTCVRFMTTGTSIALPQHQSYEGGESCGVSVRGESNASSALQSNGTCSCQD